MCVQRANTGMQGVSADRAYMQSAHADAILMCVRSIYKDMTSHGSVSCAVFTAADQQCDGVVTVREGPGAPL